MGKWTELKDTLTRFRPEASWQQQVDRCKREKVKLNGKEKTIRTCDKVELAKLFAAYDAKKREAEETVKKANTYLEAINQLLVDRLETEDVTSFKAGDGSVVYIQDDVYVTYEGEDGKAKLERYLLEQDLTNLFSIHHKTLEGLVKAALVSGEDLPPGVKPFMKTSIRVRKPGTTAAGAATPADNTKEEVHGSI